MTTNPPLGLGRNDKPAQPILIAKADQLYGECLKRAIVQLMPWARPIHVTCIAAGREFLTSIDRCALVVCGVGFPDGDALAWLEEMAGTKSAERILVVTARKEMRVHATLREIAIHGVFDAFEGGLAELSAAIQVVISGGYFLSPSFRDILQQPEGEGQHLFKQLTIKEQLVLSVIGDGSDNHEAAERLGMSEAAIRSHRKRIHVKLGVAHKGELMRTAIRHGFVRLTRSGTVRPGFDRLLRQTHSTPPFSSAFEPIRSAGPSGA